jgi:hypothetical protein
MHINKSEKYQLQTSLSDTSTTLLMTPKVSICYTEAEALTSPRRVTGLICEAGQHPSELPIPTKLLTIGLSQWCVAV